MDEPVLVGDVECSRDLVEDEQRASEAERPFLLEDVREVAALDIAHRDVQAAAFLARVEDRDDVRMVEAGGDMGLLQEAVAKLIVPFEEP